MAGRRSALLLGLVIGGGLGAAAMQQYEAGIADEANASASAYVEVRRMPLPLTTAEGRLVRYAAVDFALEVPADRRGQVRRLLPEVRHAMNMAAHETPLALDPSGRIDVDRLRTLTETAARTALTGEEVRSAKVLAAQQI
ncbi:MAG: hypothetical protein AAF205_05860 [Pseudomonadota bacterium]